MAEFPRMTRMDFETYDYLLSLIVDDISKQDTTMRKAIPASARLAVTLRYLAHGYYYYYILKLEYFMYLHHINNYVIVIALS